MEKKRVLREFQWFEVQTKVRELISEILQPLEKKVGGQGSSIVKLQETTREEHNRLDQITMMINKDENIFEKGILSCVEERFRDQAVLIQELAHKVEHLQGFVSAKAKLLDDRLAESTQVLTGLTGFKDYVKAEFQGQEQRLLEAKASTNASFQAVDAEITALQLSVQTLKAQLAAANKKSEKAEATALQIKKETEKKMHQLYQDVTSAKNQTSIAVQRLGELKLSLARTEAFQRSFSKLESLYGQQQVRVDNLQYKIEVIQPLVSFAQINEYAHRILPQKYHRNISVYYYNKYGEMLEEILATQFQRGKVRESAQGNIQLIKNVHKRALKLAFKLKKEVLESRGINLDHLSHQKKEESLAAIKLQENTKSIADADLEYAKKEIVPDSAPKIMPEQFQSFAKELRDKILVQLNDSKSYIRSMEDLLRRDQDNIEKSLETLRNNVDELGLNFQLEQKAQNQAARTIEKGIGALTEQAKGLRLAVRELYDIVLVFNEIQKQDQRDRQAITLMGVRERHRDEVKEAEQRRTGRGTVSLKDECLSCSGNPNYYNQFFKMACLTYTSSPIAHNGHSYQRIDLIEKLQSRLQEVHQILSDQPKHSQQLALDSARKSRQEDRSHSNSQIMRLPVKEAPSQRFTRNISSSQDMRAGSSEEPRIIQPGELTSQLLASTRNRLFSRKLERSFRESKSKKDSSKERSEYMKTVGRYFRELSGQFSSKNRP